MAENNSDSGDEFGDFEGVTDDQEQLVSYVNDLVPKVNLGDVCQQKHDLEELLAEERPRVIYEQLVELHTVLQPITWKSSYLRSHLLHVMRLEEHDKSDKHIIEEAVDDQLYTRICSMLPTFSAEQVRSPALILRDQFKYMYAPPLTHSSLQGEAIHEQEEHVPSLLAVKMDSIQSAKEMEQYHDKLCNAIDALIVTLKQIELQQANLTADKTTYENVVTNLTGHTQRLQRDEIELYNKHKNRRKRFSWIGR